MYSEQPIFARQGWECPKCGRVYSPDTPMCWYCGDESKSTVTTTNTKLDIPFPEDLVKVVSENHITPEAIKKNIMNSPDCPCIRCEDIWQNTDECLKGCDKYKDWVTSNGLEVN